jgi:DNA modification methylase
MSRRFLDGKVELHCGDSREVLKTLPEASVDSVVCDPPYALVSMTKPRPDLVDAGNPYARRQAAAGFMGKTWDTGETAFATEFWAQVLRVLKPGGHLVAFSGTRTYHRLACAIEDAGFEIRDQLAWCYASGFPKSLDVSKAIDKAAGAEREVIGVDPVRAARLVNQHDRYVDNPGEWQTRGRSIEVTAPATPAARQWQGYGTALKPAYESICLAQKPYDLRAICSIVAPNIMGVICRLASNAKDAGPSSSSSPRGSSAGRFGSAQWAAVAACNTPDDLFALTATWPSGWAMPSSLNTALSWLTTLVEVSRHASMFTTETASSLTTDLRTLNSLLSRIMRDTTADPATLLDGTASSASLVASIFSAVAARLKLTRELSVLDPATYGDAFSDIRPNWNPIVLARKPLIGTVAANVLEHGTGALNIGGCRIETADDLNGGAYAEVGGRNVSGSLRQGSGMNVAGKTAGREFQQPAGRWPANLIHDGSEEVVSLFPETTSGNGDRRSPKEAGTFGAFAGTEAAREFMGDSGSAARFFYTSKADADDRLGSKHPTVKPVDLMQWLVRLVTPRGGTCLDPFAGTGTTGEAAWREGCRAILIEREEEYQADIARRMELAQNPTKRAAVAATKNQLDDPNSLPLFGGWPVAAE